MRASGRNAIFRRAGALLLLASCAGRPPAAQLPATVTLHPPPGEATAAAGAAPLPALPVDQVAGLQEQRLHDFQATDEDLRVVVRELAQGFGLDYRIAPEVTGRVNVRLQSVTLEDALRAIVSGHGYEYQLQDQVLYVGPARVESRMFTLDYVALTRVGQSSTVIQRRVGNAGVRSGAGQTQPGIGGAQSLAGGGSDVITSTSVADLWDEVRVALEAIVFGAGTDAENVERAQFQPRTGIGSGATAWSRSDAAGRMVVINPMAGTILVHAGRGTMREIEAFIGMFEASIQRQVLIEAKIVEVRLDRGHEFGIDWSAVQRIGQVDLRVGTAPAAGGLQFTLRGGSNQITAVLQSLSEQGDVRVLSSPQVSALNNQRAIFNVTTDEVIFTVSRQPIIGPTGGTIGFSNEIQTNQIAVGIVLDVFPQISADNTVSMNIRPAITSVARIESIRVDDGTEARAPVIDRREIDTFARVRPGETIVIGGLMQTRSERRRSGVPLLKDLPLLGYVFGRTSVRETRGELVIFITPTIVSGQPGGGG